MNIKKNLSEYPDLIKEFDFENNKPFLPKDFSTGSNKEIWWKCLNNHKSYKRSIKIKIKTKTSCIECRSLKYNFPDVFEKLHKTKNNFSNLEFISKASVKKLWWICERGHEYQDTPAHQAAQKRGCNKCRIGFSRPQLRFFCELVSIFKNISINYKYKNIDSLNLVLKNKLTKGQFSQKEIDIYIHDIFFGIEYDGAYYHDKRKLNDLLKNAELRDSGIEIIRLREKPLKKLNKSDVIVDPYNLQKKDVDTLLTNIKKIVLLSEEQKNKIDIYLSKKHFQNENLFLKYSEYFRIKKNKKSIVDLFPDLAKEWDYKKNYPLIPVNFSRGSNVEVWWKCSNDHSFKKKISLRVKGSAYYKCAKCSGQVLSKTNNLLATQPELCKYLDKDKNGTFDPSTVFANDKIKVWWKCSLGHSKRYPINSRYTSFKKEKKFSCDICFFENTKGFRKIKDKTKSLFYLYPDLIEDWDYENNNKIDPKDIGIGSSYVASWKCAVCGYKWKTRVSHRTKDGSGCKYKKNHKLMLH